MSSLVDGVERRADLPDGDERRRSRPGSRQGGVSSRTSWPRSASSVGGRTRAPRSTRGRPGRRRRRRRHRDPETRRAARRGLRRTGARAAAPTRDRRARSPARTSSKCAASSTDRAIGPAVERPSSEGNGARRDAAARRLQAEEAAARSGDPDRAAAVGAVRERDEAGREGGRRTSARPAGREVRVPRVAGRAVELGLRERDGPELRRVRLAEDHEARVAEPSHDGRVEVRDVVGERAARVGRADACGRREVLDRDRDAAERRVVGARVCGARVGEGVLAADGHERVERRDRVARSARGRARRARPTTTSPVRIRRACSVGREERELHRERTVSASREMARAGLEPATPRFSAVCSTS